MKHVTEYNQKVRTSRKMPELRSGDIVKIHRKIKEGAKERVQVFEGIVIAIKAKQSSSPLLTVRRVSHGIGVEIIIPVFSPAIEKIEAVKRAKTRQAKLYYLRKKDFKLSKLKMKNLEQYTAKPASNATQGVAGGEESIVDSVEAEAPTAEKAAKDPENKEKKEGDAEEKIAEKKIED